MMEATPTHSLVLVLQDAARLGDVLEAAFTHPWVASYQVGYGPPLVRANTKLVARLKEARGTFQKLRAYLDCCILDDEECARLAKEHRRILSRRRGPLEAEEVNRACGDALDLSFRLYTPNTAPPDVAEQMVGHGIDPEAGAGLGPDELSARFLILLGDPRNERLLFLPEVAEQAPAEQSGMALDLRVPVAFRDAWQVWLPVFAGDCPVDVGAVILDRLVSHARVTRNGERA